MGPELSNRNPKRSPLDQLSPSSQEEVSVSVIPDSVLGTREPGPLTWIPTRTRSHPATPAAETQQLRGLQGMRRDREATCHQVGQVGVAEIALAHDGRHLPWASCGP